MARRPSDLFELWDFESRNLLGAYESEEQALAVVRVMVDEYGMDGVRLWGLGHDRRGKLVSLLEGEDLARRALKSSDAAHQRSGAAD